MNQNISFKNMKCHSVPTLWESLMWQFVNHMTIISNVSHSVFCSMLFLVGSSHFFSAFLVQVTNPRSKFRLRVSHTSHKCCCVFLYLELNGFHIMLEWFDFVPDTFMYSSWKKIFSYGFCCFHYRNVTYRMDVLHFSTLGFPRYNLDVLICCCTLLNLVHVLKILLGTLIIPTSSSN